MSFLSITIRWTFFQSCLPKKSFGRFAQSYLVIFKELLSYRSTPLKVKPSLSLDLFLKSKAAHKELSSTLCQAFFPTFFLFFLKSFSSGQLAYSHIWAATEKFCWIIFNFPLSVKRPPIKPISVSLVNVFFEKFLKFFYFFYCLLICINLRFSETFPKFSFLIKFKWNIQKTS